MKTNINVGAVMTALPRAVEVDTPLRAARELMRRRGIRHLPVWKGDAVVGLLTDRDLKRALDPDLGLPPVEELFVGDVEDTPLDQVVAEMADLHIGSVIVERDGDLVGIFTATDACRLLGEYLRHQTT